MSFAKKISPGIILLLIIASCSSGREQPFNEVYYEKSEKEWLSSLEKLGYEDKSLQNHILLVIQTTECAPCLQELAWWNTQGEDETEAEVTLLVIERYEASFTTFLEVQDIQLLALWDSTGILFEHDLIPTTPIKLYFSDKGNILAMNHMGTEGNIQSFLKYIETK